MAQKPNILQPREPLLDKQGGVARAWWRCFNDLVGLSGSTLNPLVVPPNSIIASGDFSTGGTIALANSPPGTILGNSSAVAEPPTPQTVDPSLSFTGGTLAAATQAPNTLTGNASGVDAIPGAIIVGTNLTLDSASRTLNAAGAASSLPLIEKIAYWGM